MSFHVPLQDTVDNNTPQSYLPKMDTTNTVSTEPKPKRRPGKPIVADWDAIRTKFIEGVPIKSISDQFAIKACTICKRASTNKWYDARREFAKLAPARWAMGVANQIVTRNPQVIQLDPATLSNRVLDQVNRSIRALELADPSADNRTMEIHARVLRTVNDVARTTLGLDAPAVRGSNVTLNLAVHAGSPSGPRQLPHEIIDVESSESSAQAAGEAPEVPENPS